MKKKGFIQLCLFCTFRFYSQDVHWSQASNALLFQNPAFAGVLAPYSFAANYRDQWDVLGGTYKTMMAAGDFRFQQENKPNILSLGGMIYNDAAGSGNYRNTAGGLMLSYHVLVNKFVKLGGGIGFNYVQNLIFSDTYTWGNQFNGQVYDPSKPSGEGNIGAKNNYADLKAGLSYVYDASNGLVDYTNNAKIIAGYSINHLNRPDIAVFGAGDKLKLQHNLFVNAFLPWVNNLTLKPSLIANLNGSMYQITAGNLFRYSIGQVSRITGIKKGSAFAFGFLYRYRDALITAFEYETGNVLFGLSYDLNISRLTPASNFRGGIELSFRIKAPGDYLYKSKPGEKEPQRKPRSNTRTY